MSRPARPLTPHLVAAALAAPALVAGTAGAATITVNTALDADAVDGLCSLREALVAANSDAAHNDCPAGDGPDRIVFALTTPAEVDLTADLPVITETLLIRGPGPGPLDLVLDGADLRSLLHFDTAAGGWLGVEQLTLYRGRSPLGAGDDGGGAFVETGETAWFRRVAFVENLATDGGGGLAVHSEGYAGEALHSSVTLLECLFQGNVAEGINGGGGLLVVGTGGEARIVRSTFFDNQAEHDNGSGGAIKGFRPTVVLEASTLSGNRANNGGGGVMMLLNGTPPLSATLAVRDATITENDANFDADLDGEGGGLAFSVGTGFTADLELVNSVVAGNLDTGAQDRLDLSCGGDVQLVAGGAAFVGSNESCETIFPDGFPNAGGDYVGTTAAPLDPVLGPLGDNGGPLPTHRPDESVPPFGALGVPSPLIDHGHCPGAIEDQRGFGDVAAGRRRFDHPNVSNGPGSDGCDIGAVEVATSPGADPTIFADGFEAGHTLFWTSEVPGR